MTTTETGTEVPPTAAPGSITPKQMRHLNVLLSRNSLRDRTKALAWIGSVLGGPVESRKELSQDDASMLIDRLIENEAGVDTVPDPDTPPVQEAIRRAMADVGMKGVGKTGTNREQGYQFRSIADVMNTLSPILSKHGIVIVPYVHEIQISDRATRSGSTQMFAVLTVDYEIVGPRGDSLHARVVGTGADTSDKATNKALSGAYKYLLGQVFAIPEAGWTDADYESPEIGSRNGQQQQAHENDNSALLARIGDYARQSGRTVEEYTAKFRQRNGNVSVAEMSTMPRGLLYGFVKNLEEWYAQEQEPGQQHP